MGGAVAVAKVQAAAPPAMAHGHSSIANFEPDSMRTQSQTDQWLAFLGGQGIRPKLTLSTPGDAEEREADAMADRVMRMVGPGPMRVSDGQIHRKCATCMHEEKEVVSRKADGANASASLESPDMSTLNNLGVGVPLPSQERSFFEPRMGFDLSSVRIHADGVGNRAARSIQARAFTKGNDIGFAQGEYRPGTTDGRHLMAHELAHVMQHNAGMVRRQLSAADCSTDCAGSDGKEAVSGKYTLTIMTDKEGPFLLIPLTSNVGHSWLKLQDDQGNYWTYGFWPESGFDPNNSTADVNGCVHHPDHAHDSHITSSQTFEISSKQFMDARSYAESICNSKPKYNLFHYNCTSFVRHTTEAAGQSSGGFGLIWDSPNALDGWMRVHALEIGANFTAATSAPNQQAQGNFGLELAYRQQFFSTLGNKLRLYGVGQGEWGSAIKTSSAGIGVSVDPQYVWLPSLYLEGKGTFGDMHPGLDKFGAGVTAGYGLNYKIDAFGSIGIEHNFLKDFVNDDPVLGRLLIKAKINLW